VAERRRGWKNDLEHLEPSGPKEEINGAIEAVSFDDTLERLQEVFEEGRSEGQTIPVCS
jgi:hypothetical protein